MNGMRKTINKKNKKGQTFFLSTRGPQAPRNSTTTRATFFLIFPHPFPPCTLLLWCQLMVTILIMIVLALGSCVYVVVEVGGGGGGGGGDANSTAARCRSIDPPPVRWTSMASVPVIPKMLLIGDSIFTLWQTATLPCDTYIPDTGFDWHQTTRFSVEHSALHCWQRTFCVSLDDMYPDILLGHTSIYWWCGRELSGLCVVASLRLLLLLWQYLLPSQQIKIKSSHTAAINPFCTAVPSWGQSTLVPGDLSSKRDCGLDNFHS